MKESEDTSVTQTFCGQRLVGLDTDTWSVGPHPSMRLNAPKLSKNETITIQEVVLIVCLH
jgi:hypothetical protein